MIKGRLAEQKIAHRLLLTGCEPYQRLCGSSVCDLLAYVPDTGNVFKIQVRVCRNRRVSIVRSATKQRYSAQECDFLIAYDIDSDNAYVYSHAEISKRKSAVFVSDEHLERWDKIC